MVKKWTNVTLAYTDAEYIFRAYLDPNERRDGWVRPFFEKDEVLSSVDKEMQDMPAGKDNTISFTLYDYSK